MVVQHLRAHVLDRGVVALVDLRQAADARADAVGALGVERDRGLGRTLETIGNRLIERLVAPERTAVGDSERFLTEQLGLRRAELEAAEKALADFKTSNAALLPSVYSSSLARLTDLKGKLEERSLALATADAAFNDLRTRLVSTNPVIGRLEQEIVQVSGELSTLQSRYTDDLGVVAGVA